MKALRYLITLVLAAAIVSSDARAFSILDPHKPFTGDQPRVVFNRDGVLAFLEKQPAIEYGRAEDLRGATTVFIHTDLQIEERENIAANIRKKLPQIIFTNRPEDADIYLVFRSVEEKVLSGIDETTRVEETKDKSGAKKKTTVTTQSTPVYEKVVYGQGFVFKREGEGTVRLVMEFNDKQKSFFERKPSTNFARAFVKAFQSANK